MSKTNFPNYARTPANVLVLEQRVIALAEFNSALLGLLVENLPSLKDKAQTLTQQAAGVMAQLDSLNGQLLLSGHGARGVKLSERITTAKEEAAFTAKFPKPVEAPFQPDQVIKQLEQYLALDGATENGGRAFTLPDPGLFGNQYRDATDIIEKDLMAQPDGLWVLNTDKAKVYTLKVSVGEHVLLFSPATGLAAVTYSDIEQQWIRHTDWRLIDHAATIAAIDAFFSKTNVHDASQGELNKLYLSAIQIPQAVLETLGTVTGAKNKDITLNLGEFFKVRMTFEGKHSIDSVRDDLQWSDLTLQTRRRMFRDLVKQINELREAHTDKEPAPAKKTVAKKAVKKAVAKKAAKA